MQNLSNELKVAIEAAKLGAKKACSYFKNNLNIEYKIDASPVTIADRETEKTIIKYIKAKFPNAKFLGEERGGKISEGDLWIIDPIDGTKSFVRGIPTWCVIVSLSRNEKIIVSVVYYPNNDMLYYAQKDKGAYINGSRMHVSKLNDLSKSYIGYGSIKHFKNKQHLINLIDKIGSARSWEIAFSGCMVAEGKMDIALDAHGKVWDTSPIKLLVTEAGGKVTRTDGVDWSLEGQGIISTNGILHKQALDILNSKTP